jgi:hypothetical protein
MNWPPVNYLLIALIAILTIILVINLLYRDGDSLVESFDSNTSINVRLTYKKSLDYTDGLIWSNKLETLDNNLVFPLSFWNPKLSGGDGYLMLGDAISLTNTYNAPDHATILVTGDTPAPISYTKIVDIPNPNLDEISAEAFNDYILLINSVKSFSKDHLQTMRNLLIDIRDLLPSYRDMLNAQMITQLTSNIQVQRYINIINGQHGEFYMYDTGVNFVDSTFLTPLQVNNIMLSCWGANTCVQPSTAVPKSGTDGYRTYHVLASNVDVITASTSQLNKYNEKSYTWPQPYSDEASTTKYFSNGSDYIVTIPQGCRIIYTNGSANGIDIAVNTTPNDQGAGGLNSTGVNPPSIYDIVINNNPELTFNKHIVHNPIKVSLNTLITSQTLSIKMDAIIAEAGKVASSAFTDVLSGFKTAIAAYVDNGNAMVIYNNYVAAVTCKANNYPQYVWDFVNAADINNTIAASTDPNDMHEFIAAKVNTIAYGWDASVSADMAQMLRKLSNYVIILDYLMGGDVGNIPLLIYRPEPPHDGYISLGDVVVTRASDVEYINEYPRLACIPATCVKQVRPWKSTDLIYENIGSGQYYALYNNPYTGTFKTVTTQGDMPDGMVCKVIACVQGPGEIDKLIKSDKCARKAAEINKNMRDSAPLVNQLAYSAEDEYTLNKIAKRDTNIAAVRKGVDLITAHDAQVDAVNAVTSRRVFDTYLSQQASNIDNLLTNLEKRNDIAVNLKLPPRFNMMQVLIDIINKSALRDKEALIARLLASQKGKKQEISPAELKSRLNEALDHCPELNPNMIKKSVINSICYGCNI